MKEQSTASALGNRDFACGRFQSSIGPARFVALAPSLDSQPRAGQIAEEFCNKSMSTVQKQHTGLAHQSAPVVRVGAMNNSRCLDQQQVPLHAGRALAEQTRLRSPQWSAAPCY